MVCSRTMLRAGAYLSFATLAASFPFSLDLLKPRQSTCYSGVYVIGARGTEESAGFGSTQEVVSMITQAIPNSGSYAVNYPASALDPIYPSSVSDGIKDTISHIQSYVDSCKGKIVLVGFSQGGNVMTDTLAGGVDKPTPISSSYADFIVGITVFGDPTFTSGQSFDQGSATGNGIFSRGGSSLQALNAYASKLKSYCQNGDIYCDSGTNSSVHKTEVPTFAQDATNFIVQLNQAFSVPGSAPSGSPSGVAPSSVATSFSAYPGYSSGSPNPSSGGGYSSQPAPTSGGGGGYSSPAPQPSSVGGGGYSSPAPQPSSVAGSNPSPTGGGYVTSGPSY